MKNKLISFISILFFSSLIIKILNFGKEIQISYFYGTSTVVDQYNMLLILPNLVLNSIAPALGITLISLIDNDNKSIKLKKNYLHIVVSLLIIFSIFYIIYMNFIGINFYLVIIGILLTILFFIQVLLVHYLHAFNEFKLGAFSTFIQIVVSISIIFLSAVFNNIFILLVSLMLGLLVQCLFISAIIMKKNIVIKQVKKEYEFPVYNSIITMVLGYGLFEIVITIQKVYLEALNIEGLVSGLNYAYKIMNLPISIFVIAIISAVFPTLNKISDKSEVKEYFEYIINFLSLALIPISFILYWKSNTVVQILFQRGDFNQLSTDLTSKQLEIVCLTIIPLSFIVVLIRLLYINGEWKKIYIITTSIILSVFLLNSLFYSFNITGNITYSIPLSMVIGLVILSILLKFNLLSKELVKIVISFLCSSFISLSILNFNTFFETLLIVNLLFETSVFIGFYLIFLIFMKNQIIFKVNKIFKMKKFV